VAVVTQALEVFADRGALDVAHGKYLCYPAFIMVANVANQKNTG